MCTTYVSRLQDRFFYIFRCVPCLKKALSLKAEHHSSPGPFSRAKDAPIHTVILISPLAGQPTPEVLYLCTTCGGTLRRGEDGRWRRRRRPSSAPAARRHRVFGSGNQILTRWDVGGGIPAATTGEVNGDGEGFREWAEGGKPGRIAHEVRNREESIAKLRYACCARCIQNAYQDFRHRQYLKDWASSLVSRE